MRTDVTEFPGSLGGPWNRYVHEPDERGVGTVRYPRRVAKDSLAAKSLAKVIAQARAYKPATDV